MNRAKFKSKKEEVRPDEKQGGLIYYDHYAMTSAERIKYLMIAATALFIVGFIFYKSLLLSLILACLSIFYPVMKKKDIIEKQKKMLSVQFKEGLYSLNAALAAGRSIESAFEEAIKDLMILYQSEETFIISEFDLISKKIKLNMTVEEAVQDFADRSANEDVKNFADVFVTCKRTGGDLINVIKNTSESIGDKIQIEQEIETLIAEKKFEQKVLNIMPIGLVAFLSLTAGDFMTPVYTTLTGHAVMTIALMLFALSYAISKKMMNIEV